jgi:hypothetical protein
MKNKLAALTLSVFLIFGFASPSFAGSGTDGNIEITWTDQSKKKFKSCSNLKLKVSLIKPFDIPGPRYMNLGAYLSGDFRLYNSEDDEIASKLFMFDSTLKKKNFPMQICGSKIGKGPYYAEINWSYNIFKEGSGSYKEENTFETPFKFKK